MYDFGRDKLVSVELEPRGDYVGVYPGRVGGTHVVWDVGRLDLAVVQQCPRGPELLQELPIGYHFAEEEFYKMVTGEETYTLRQIGEQFEGLNLNFELNQRITKGRCACDFYFAEQS